MAVSPPTPHCHRNKKQMYGSQSTQVLETYDSPPKPHCHTFVSYFRVFHWHVGMSAISVCVWPTALKLGCITNFDTFSRDGVHLFG